MRKLFFILVAAAIALTGCQSHYYKINDDSVSMYLKNPEAGSVLFASSQEGFNCQKASKTDDRTWEVTLPYTSGFSYFYIVDGKVFIPPCRFKENDDFGSENCLFIPEP